jgi:hypothetical protein
MDFLNEHYVNMWHDSDYHFEHIILKKDISKIITTYLDDLDEFGEENTHGKCYKFDKSLATLFKHSYKNYPIISKHTLDYHINEMLSYQPPVRTEQDFVMVDNDSADVSIQTEPEPQQEPVEPDELENYKENDMLYIYILILLMITMWYLF